ncbi:MAG TPA: hypothetical protein VLM79_20620 [Kofleriaceae bacterium]|nr:hypothetical protein [Kofleriaceae bacterium]
MKKLTIAVALLSLSIAAPVFACPGHDEAPRTAEKAKEADPPKSAEKAKAAKPADKATTAKPAGKAKPADKVSQR